MALTQTLLQLRTSVRKMADAAGTSALVRHPDADVNDYINRGLGAVFRLLSMSLPDQRFLATTSITTSQGISLYTLPADFDHLISIDITANGTKSWVMGYEMHEHASLTDPAATYTGIPFTYRLRGASIDLLPTPGNAYTVNLWYVPNASQLASDGATWDTISRLDDYVIAFAVKLIAVRDKKFELANECRLQMKELEDEIRAIARTRDKNSPSRIVDEYHADRWGRRRMLPRRWR